MKTEVNEKWIVCRVCLSNPTEGEDLLQDIFSQNANTRLDQMLHICAGIPVSISTHLLKSAVFSLSNALQVSVDDNFPDKMCSKCVRVLRVAYKFRLTCQRSHQHIADMLATEFTTSLGGAEEDEEDDTEAIARDWEESTKKINPQIKTEQYVDEAADTEFISYVVAGEDVGTEGETIVYDATSTEEDPNSVQYDGATVVALTEEAEAEVESETEAENFAEYEELEVLASESVTTTNTSPSANRGTRRIVWSDVPEYDIVRTDILSSDDESYIPEAKAQQPRLLNRVRQPRKVQQRPKASVSSLDGVREEKRLGRKPRDKHSNYICDVCGNIYPSQARLTEHMKFHSGVKPHECE